MSHHYSGPRFGFPHGDARLNLTDLYAFPKPDGRGKSILVMNVHPSANWDRSPTVPEPFSTEALYELKIDTNEDAVADIAFRVRFSSAPDGAQFATLRRVVGAVNNMKFTGEDFFADKDVCSIVLEVPNDLLGPNRLGIWARTLTASGGGWVQADRGARPAQAIFLVGDHGDAYITAEPLQDAQFIPVFGHSLEHTGGYTPLEARRVAGTLLPDILYFDPARPASYPNNGRALTDDVLDHFLSVITNGKITTDGVGPHADLLPEFPYLGPPHRLA
jgi:hypothetical protein